MLAPAAFPAHVTGGNGPTAKAAAVDCGTFSSTSIYPTAKVIALRGVKCSRALQLAVAFDRKGKQLDSWRCGLAHGDLPALFSCGKGGKKGDLRKRPHALLAKGVGSPTS